MADGPNYEDVFRKMQVFHGGSAEDVKIIVRYLRFFRGQDGYDMYLKHYLPMLSPEVAAEFIEIPVETVKEEPKVEVTEEVKVTAEEEKPRRKRKSKLSPL